MTDLTPEEVFQEIRDRWRADLKGLKEQGDKADWSELVEVGTHGHRCEAERQRNEARRQKCLQTKPHLYRKSRP